MSIPARSWQDDAACRQTAVPDVFFPAGNNARMDAALSYCHSCAVVDECLQAALDEEAGVSRGLIYGVRGGHGPGARYRMQKGVA